MGSVVEPISAFLGGVVVGCWIAYHSRESHQTEHIQRKLYLLIAAAATITILGMIFISNDYHFFGGVFALCGFAGCGTAYTLAVCHDFLPKAPEPEPEEEKPVPLPPPNVDEQISEILKRNKQ